MNNLDIKKFLFSEDAGWKILLLCMLAALVTIVFTTQHNNYICNWSDRDLVRSADILNHFEYLGAELSYGGGGRVPGGFLHYLWAIPLHISNNHYVSYLFSCFLTILSLIPMYAMVGKRYGTLAGLFSVLFFLTCSATFGVAFMLLYNPTFQILFVVLADYFFLKYLIDNEYSALKWSFGALALAAQLHLSAAIGYIPFIMSMILCSEFKRSDYGCSFIKSAVISLFTSRNAKSIWAAVGMILLAYSSYFIGEILNDYSNTKMLLDEFGQSIPKSKSSGISVAFVNIKPIIYWFFSHSSLDLPAGRVQDSLWFLLLSNIHFICLSIMTLYFISHYLQWGKWIGSDRFLSLFLTGKKIRGILLYYIVFVCGILYFIFLNSKVELYQSGSSRYLFFMVPAVCILSGVSVARCLSCLKYRANETWWFKTLRWLLNALIMVCLFFQCYHFSTTFKKYENQSIKAGRGGNIRYIDVVKKNSGWDIYDVAARTSFWFKSNGRWKIITELAGAAYELYVESHEFPGSQYGEGCFYLINGADTYKDGHVPRSVLNELIAYQYVDSLKVHKTITEGNDLLVFYTRLGHRTLSSSSMRYVLTEKERVMFSMYNKLDVDKPSRVKSPENEYHVISRIGKIVYAYFVFSTLKENAMVVTLHSNQLRGTTCNLGFFDEAMLQTLSFTLTDLDSKERFVFKLAEGLVGFFSGVLTPIKSHTIRIPDGRYNIQFHTSVIKGHHRDIWPMKLSLKDPITLDLGNISIKGNTLKASNGANL